MESSILTSIKKVLGVDEAYTVFDRDILMHINAAFSTLTQLGVGPPEGFLVEDETTAWEDFLGEDPRLNSAKSYVYLKTRMLFDPPATSFHIEAMNEQIKEFEWRLTVQVEGV